jgi:rhamnogalacturonyl hydrolase YesR
MFHMQRHLPAFLILALDFFHTVICTGHVAQKSFAVHAASSAMLRGQGNGLTGPASASSSTPLVSYEHGEFQWALRLLYERDGNKTYFDYIKIGVDNVVSSNGSVGGAYVFNDYSLDPIRAGPSFVYM